MSYFHCLSCLLSAVPRVTQRASGRVRPSENSAMTRSLSQLTISVADPRGRPRHPGAGGEAPGCPSRCSCQYSAVFLSLFVDRLRFNEPTLAETRPRRRRPPHAAATPCHFLGFSAGSPRRASLACCGRRAANGLVMVAVLSPLS